MNRLSPDAGGVCPLSVPRKIVPTIQSPSVKQAQAIPNPELVRMTAEEYKGSGGAFD